MINKKTRTVQNLLFVLLAGAGVVLAGNAAAVGLGIGAKADVQARGEAGPAAGNAGINGGANMSVEGSANQNSQVLPDATSAQERASERKDQAIESASERKDQAGESAAARRSQIEDRVDSLGGQTDIRSEQSVTSGRR